MLFKEPEKFCEVIIFGSDKSVWLENEEIEDLNNNRRRRMADGFFINTGPNIIDPLVEEELVEGGSVHLLELSNIMTQSEFFELNGVMRDEWRELCAKGRRPNPRWIDE